MLDSQSLAHWLHSPSRSSKTTTTVLLLQVCDHFFSLPLSLCLSSRQQLVHSSSSVCCCKACREARSCTRDGFSELLMFAEEKGPSGKEEEEAAQHGEEGFSSAYGALDDSTQQETLVPIYFFKSQQLECFDFFLILPAIATPLLQKIKTQKTSFALNQSRVLGSSSSWSLQSAVYVTEGQMVN